MVYNGKSAAPRSRFRGDEMAAFDRLPAALRHALWEAVIRWDAREIRWSLNKRLEAGADLQAATLDELGELHREEREELVRWAYHWPSRFGKYPHHAAEASVQKYGGRQAEQRRRETAVR